MRRNHVDWAVSIAVMVAAGIVLVVPPSWVADLGPMPDAGEYAISARNLARQRGFTIDVLGHPYPPRYPIGFPLLLAPVYWMPFASLASGIYTVIAFSVATVLVTYLLARRLTGLTAGAVAAVTLLTRPTFLDWSHQVMTETATALAAISVALLLHGRTTTAHPTDRRWYLLIGAVCGIAMLMRLTNILLAAAAAPLVGLTAVLTGVGVARALQLIGARRTARLRASVAGGLTCLAFAIGVILDMRPSAARTYAGQRVRDAFTRFRLVPVHSTRDAIVYALKAS